MSSESDPSATHVVGAAPIDPREMINGAYFFERLDDPTLLERAVDVGEAAVPVGGKRRGGYACVSDTAEAERVIAVLSKHEGFPNLRIELSDDPEVMGNVLWGEEPPACPATEAPDIDWMCFNLHAGRFYGYSEKAIRAFITERRGQRTATRVFKMWPLGSRVRV